MYHTESTPLGNLKAFISFPGFVKCVISGYLQMNILCLHTRSTNIGKQKCPYVKRVLLLVSKPLTSSHEKFHFIAC